MALALAAIGAGPASAQTVPLNFKLPDDYYTRIVELAREALPTARLANGKPVPLESAEERAQPLLPADIERRIIDTGVVSGLASWCGLDWTTLFRRMMLAERGAKQWNDKQLAYIGLLHGVSQGAIENSTRQQGSCTAKDKPRMSELLARTAKIYDQK